MCARAVGEQGDASCVAYVFATRVSVRNAVSAGWGGARGACLFDTLFKWDATAAVVGTVRVGV